MNEKIAILNDLGDPTELDIDDTSKWPDYLEYGFTASDVPDLIAIITDEDLYEEPKGKRGMWVHLHAWRTLGQLKAVDAIDSLISVFEFFSLVEDNTAFKELPEVIGMIGKPAIEAVGNYLCDASNSSHSRLIANDALANIAKTHPDCRDSVLEKYKTYLSTPDCFAQRLNGFLIKQLIDLKAVELIDNIRSLYKQGCVDLSVAGELEDLEATFESK